MRQLLRSIELTGVTLTGGFLLFVIIGVFGIVAAITGLIVLVIVAVVTYRAFPEAGVSHEA
jgi:hypothetical protein